MSDSLTGEENTLSKIGGNLETTAEGLTDVMKPFSTEEVRAFTAELNYGSIKALLRLC